MQWHNHYHFSTSAINKSLNYWESVYEKDRGQETDNPHLIAKRHLSTGEKTDANIINLVLSKLGLGYAITQLELDQLSSILPISIKFDNLTLRSSAAHHKNLYSKFLRRSCAHNLVNKIRGVYVWTNLKTGDQNVGSSIDLTTRLRHYFKPSILNKGIRLINKDIQIFGIEKFKLDIYIIDSAVNP